MLFRKKALDSQEIFLQPPPGKRYVRSFFFARKINAPFARIHLIPRTLLVLALSGVELRAIDTNQPDLVTAACLWIVCLLIFFGSGMHMRVARVYLLLSVPTLLSLFTTWLLFNPVPGSVTLLRTQIYDGTITFALSFWQGLWLVLLALIFWKTRKILLGMIFATFVVIVLPHWLVLPQWTLGRIDFFHSLTVLISNQNLLVAVTKVVGYSGMVFVTVALVASSRDVELIGTMRQLRLPQPVIFFLSTVFRSLDLSLADYETIHQAQIARAINARPRSFIKRLRDLAGVAIPMVAMMIRRSSEIGDALIARGYRLNSSSADFYESSPWHWIDGLVFLVCIGLLYLAFGPHLQLTLLLQQWGWI